MACACVMCAVFWGATEDSHAFACKPADPWCVNTDDATPRRLFAYDAYTRFCTYLLCSWHKCTWAWQTTAQVALLAWSWATLCVTCTIGSGWPVSGVLPRYACPSLLWYCPWCFMYSCTSRSIFLLTSGVLTSWAQSRPFSSWTWCVLLSPIGTGQQCLQGRSFSVF